MRETLKLIIRPRLVLCSKKVVFNTGMVGYPEALTDPSYRGQVFTLVRDPRVLLSPRLHYHNKTLQRINHENAAWCTIPH
jgi:hypothetical protein